MSSTNNSNARLAASAMQVGRSSRPTPSTIHDRSPASSGSNNNSNNNYNNNSSNSNHGKGNRSNSSQAPGDSNHGAPVGSTDTQPSFNNNSNSNHSSMQPSALNNLTTAFFHETLQRYQQQKAAAARDSGNSSRFQDTKQTQPPSNGGPSPTTNVQGHHHHAKPNQRPSPAPTSAKSVPATPEASASSGGYSTTDFNVQSLSSGAAGSSATVATDGGHSESTQHKSDDHLDKDSLERKRLASRVSSRRTREREKLRLDHFRNSKISMEQRNAKLRDENQQMREAIQQLKEDKKNGVSRGASALTGNLLGTLLSGLGANTAPPSLDGQLRALLGASCNESISSSIAATGGQGTVPRTVQTISTPTRSPPNVQQQLASVLSAGMQTQQNPPQQSQQQDAPAMASMLSAALEQLTGQRQKLPPQPQPQPQPNALSADQSVQMLQMIAPLLASNGGQNASPAANMLTTLFSNPAVLTSLVMGLLNQHQQQQRAQEQQQQQQQKLAASLPPALQSDPQVSALLAALTQKSQPQPPPPPQVQPSTASALNALLAQLTRQANQGTPQAPAPGVAPAPPQTPAPVAGIPQAALAALLASATGTGLKSASAQAQVPPRPQPTNSHVSSSTVGAHTNCRNPTEQPPRKFARHGVDGAIHYPMNEMPANSGAQSVHQQTNAAVDNQPAVSALRRRQQQQKAGQNAPRHRHQHDYPTYPMSQANARDHQVVTSSTTNSETNSSTDQEADTDEVEV